MSEGVLKKQSNGRYAVCGVELTCGHSLNVYIDGRWTFMRIEHDGYDYYLLGEGVSFYPKKVRARLCK